MPDLVRWLRRGGWGRVRRRVLAAVAVTLLLFGATIALVAWAHALDAGARDGRDTAYALAFGAWALLGAADLLLWTGVAATVARRLEPRAVTLRLEARLATAVALAMGAMTAAVATWWVSVGRVAPGALTGASARPHATALVPQLLLATALILAATTVGALGARRAALGVPALDPDA